MKNSDTVHKTVTFGLPLQTLLIIGKLVGIPYLATASWWVIFIPMLLPIGIIVGILGLAAAMVVLLGVGISIFEGGKWAVTKCKRKV